MKRISRRVRPTRRTAAMVIGDGLLLILALTGLFLFQFNVYGLPGSPLVVLRACLLAAGLFLVVFSLPKYRWTAVLVLAALGIVLLWRYWDDVFQGAWAVYSTIVHVITESTDFPGEFPIPQTWTYGEIRAASNCFLTAVIFALALPLGWAVVRRRTFLPVLLLTLPWLIPIFLAEFPPDVLSLSMLAACWIVLLLTGLTTRKNPEGGARLTLAALPAALLALFCVCWIFPVEGYTYPDWASDTAQYLIEFAKDIQTRLGGGSVSSAIDLAHAGPRRYTGRSVLRVESDWTGRVYLRGAAYANYTGESWEQLGDEALAELSELAPEGSTVFPSMDKQRELSLALSSVYANPDSAEAQQTFSAAITHLNGSTRRAYYLYQPVNLLENISGASYVADSYLYLDEPEKEYTVEFIAPDEDYMEFFFLDTQDLTDEQEAYFQFVNDHYLDVPEELADIILEWWPEAEENTQYIIPNENVPATILIALSVAQVLEANTQYDLQTPVTPEGEDFVAHFLTESQRGYCVHYASAAVMLLRMCSIPARYVSGYTAEIADGKAVVPDSAAHAWVEVYVYGYGWYPVEVTPAAAFGDDPVPEVSDDNANPTMELQPEPSVQPTPESTGSPDQNGVSEREFAVPCWLYYAAVAIVILGLLALYRFCRRRRWNRLATLPDQNQAVLDAYGWYQKLTPWGGGPDSRLEALACKAKFSQHTLSDGERQEVLTILYREVARLSAKQPFWKRFLFRYLFVWK